jgi:predicted ATPase
MSPSEHLHVITGAPGSGKTPIVRALAASGFAGVDEPARAVIAEQRAMSGTDVYDRDPEAFLDLMLARSIRDYEASTSADCAVFFDRGIPDLIGYARLFDIDTTAALNAAQGNRYNDVVFALPSWRDIYTTDRDRRMTFEQAEAFGLMVRDIYVELGYSLVDVPRGTVAERAKFILETLDGAGSGPAEP